MNELQMNQNDGHGDGSRQTKFFAANAVMACPRKRQIVRPAARRIVPLWSRFLRKAWFRQLSCAFSSARLAFTGFMSARLLPAF